MDNDLELLPLVDEKGNVTGCATRAECHGGAKPLHPVVHLHLIDGEGRLLLQLRSKHKSIQPGKWDTAVGGHVDFGESIADALRREVAEEIGLDEFAPGFIGHYVFESEIERELVHVFTAVAPDGFVPVAIEDDVDDLRYFTPAEVEALIANGEATPNFCGEYARFFGRKHGGES